MTGFLLFWGWLALWVRRFDPLFGFAPPGWMRLPGLVVMLAGGSLAIACVALFVSLGRGTPVPLDPPREFVASGPYRYLRNPMYVGVLTMLAGFGLWQQSVAIILLAMLVAAVMHLFVVLLEEPELERRFGVSYINYKESVNRWWPYAGGSSDGK
jgi:protein-S-isoprenylcysteine O-methyltransferase Ste14